MLENNNNKIYLNFFWRVLSQMKIVFRWKSPFWDTFRNRLKLIILDLLILIKITELMTLAKYMLLTLFSRLQGDRSMVQKKALSIVQKWVVSMVQLDFQKFFLRVYGFLFINLGFNFLVFWVVYFSYATIIGEACYKTLLLVIYKTSHFSAAPK